MKEVFGNRAVLGRYGGDESKKDIHEANVEYLKKCREAALFTAEKQDWDIIPCSDDSEPYTKDKIFGDVLGLINRK